MTLDLRQLAVQRDVPNGQPVRRRTPWFSRYVLPATVLLAFAAVLLWAMRDWLLPTRPVTVVPVLVTKASVQAADTPLFNAAGWVEPRPTAVTVTALSEGVVEKLLVVQDQMVQAGQPVAELIRRDAELTVEDSEAALALVKAEEHSAQATLTAAKATIEHPVLLHAAVAEAEAMLAKAAAELSALPSELKSARARLDTARRELESRQAAGNAVPALALQRAINEHQAAEATVEQLRVREKTLDRELKALERQCAAHRRHLELKIDELRQQAESQARLDAAKAKVRQAQVAVEMARLRLDRMTVRAPTAGRVLSLIAQPGARLSTGMRPGESSSRTPEAQDAAAIVTLYDPQRLQVRADVRLENVPQVQPGQKVRIETAAVSQPLSGEVLFATALTNVQKNTLEVKVAIHDPPPTLKPAMLVELTFLAPPTPARSEAATERLRIFAPQSLVENTPEGPRVWVVDQTSNTARQRPITRGAAVGGNLVEITQGLFPGDKLIVSGRDGLSDGVRVQITGEDQLSHTLSTPK